MDLNGTMNVPAVGPVKKKYVLVAGVGIAAVVGFAYWRANQGGGTGLADPDLAPGEEVPADDYSSDYYGTDTGGYVNPGGSSGATSTTTEPGTVITNNQQWSNAAVDALEDVGVERGTASAVIGRYLGDQEVTSAQADLVRQALALVGDPPTGNHTIKISTAVPEQPTTPTTPTQTPGAKLAKPSGLKTTGQTKSTISVTWNKVTGAVGYRLYRSDVSTNVGASTDNMITLGGLAPNKSYSLHVRPMGYDGKYGPASATVKVKTKK